MVNERLISVIIGCWRGPSALGYGAHEPQEAAFFAAQANVLFSASKRCS